MRVRLLQLIDVRVPRARRILWVLQCVLRLLLWRGSLDERRLCGSSLAVVDDHCRDRRGNHRYDRHSALLHQKEAKTDRIERCLARHSHSRRDNGHIATASGSARAIADCLPAVSATAASWHRLALASLCLLTEGRPLGYYACDGSHSAIAALSLSFCCTALTTCG